MAPLGNNWRSVQQQRYGMEDAGGGKILMRSAPAPPQRSASFHATTSSSSHVPDHMMRRPKTHPDLLSTTRGGRMMPTLANNNYINLFLKPGSGAAGTPKVLVNVSVQRSLGPPLHIMASVEWTVEQLMGAAINQYLKERRRPTLPTSTFTLHYSQFTLQCLDPKDKLIGLGSRNFFLCPNYQYDSSSSSSSSCSTQANKLASKISIPWLRFMDFLF